MKRITHPLFQLGSALTLLGCHSPSVVIPYDSKSSAGFAYLSGVVIEGPDRKPVQGVEVFAHFHHNLDTPGFYGIRSAITGIDGSFKIPLTPGRYGFHMPNQWDAPCSKHEEFDGCIWFCYPSPGHTQAYVASSKVLQIPSVTSSTTRIEFLISQR